MATLSSPPPLYNVFTLPSGIVDVVMAPALLTTRANSDVTNKLRNLGQRFPPSPPVGVQPSSEVPKPRTLNLEKGYAGSVRGFGQLRELLQNWNDQNRKVMKALNVDLSSVKPEFDDTGAHSRMVAMAGHTPNGGSVCTGIALEWFDANSVYVQLSNFSTEIPQTALLMGSSNKQSDVDAVGMYGEGMKVEINRLVAGGAEVVVATGAGVWTFGHVMEASVEELQMRPIQFSNQQFSGHSTVLVRSTRANPVTIDRTGFLFLQDSADIGRISPAVGMGACLEMLCADTARGAVYVSGVLIKRYQADDPEGCVGFGLNYTGPKESYSQLNLGRDRNIINVKALISILPGLCSTLNSEPNLAAQVVSRIYESLLLYPDSAIRGLVEIRYFAQEDSIKLSIDLLERFLTLNSGEKPAFPVTVNRQGKAAMEAQAKEASALGVKPVEVSEPLFKLLMASGHCPTLESLWEKAADQVLGLPNWESASPSSDSGRYLLHLSQMLKAKAEEEFSPLVTHDQILFKSFPKRPSTQPCVIGAKSQAQVVYYAVDMQLLNRKEVHEWLRSECLEPPCGGGLNCSGLCTIERFETALVTAIQKATGVSERQLHRMMNTKRWKRDTTHLSPPPPQPAIEHDMHKNDNDNKLTNANQLTTTWSASPPPQTYDLVSPKHTELACSTPSHSADVPPRTISAQVDESLRALVASSAPGATITAKESAATFIPPLLVNDPKGCCVDAAKSAINLKLCPEMGGPIQVYINPGVDIHSHCGKHVTIKTTIERLRDVISLLGQHVFDLEQHASVSQVKTWGASVVWEASERVAFHRRRDGIFFNACYFHNYRHVQRPLADVLNFWFLTFCHELTHSITQSPNHDLRHLQVEEGIVRGKMQSLFQLQTRIAGDHSIRWTS